MGWIWIFHQENNPDQTSKSTQKWVTEHKIKFLTMTIPDQNINFRINIPPTHTL